MSPRPSCCAIGCCLVALAACASEEITPAPPPGFVVVTFNTGTNDGLGHDLMPDDGYTSTQAAYSDQYYGDGLAWLRAIDDTRRFFAGLEADIVVFQEIFYSGDCELVPAEARPGFVCESWQPGDPIVAQTLMAEGWQVACHVGHADKCAAVRTSFGRFAGCDADLCLEGLAGFEVPDCGGGARVGRGIVKQFQQVFVDLGDGSPGANGERNLVMGDLNTDPGRVADFDVSAAEFNRHVGPNLRFHFVTPAGQEATPSYAGLFNIDHVVSDAFTGSCWSAGIDEGHPPVTEMVYFDHKPAVCRLGGP
jgi:hypothetical protein